MAREYYTAIPRRWFLDPLYQALFATLHPFTSRTRRRMTTVELQLPLQCFEEFVWPLSSQGLCGMQLDDNARRDLQLRFLNVNRRHARGKPI